LQDILKSVLKNSNVEKSYLFPRSNFLIQFSEYLAILIESKCWKFQTN